MPISYRTRGGVKEGRFRTYSNKWGPGSVHRYIYAAELRVWHPACKSAWTQLHGEAVGRDTPVTCKHCLKGMP